MEIHRYHNYKTDNHSNTIRKFYKDNKRVDKDYKGQVSTLQGNVDFFDGTKETTLDYFDDLLQYKGQTLITTDGTTLLGADDKAGITEIVTAMEFLINNP